MVFIVVDSIVWVCFDVQDDDIMVVFEMIDRSDRTNDIVVLQLFMHLLQQYSPIIFYPAQYSSAVTKI